MKNWLKQNWFKIVIVIFLILGWYWYSWRPVQIRKKCYDISFVGETQNGELNYKSCLQDNGLNE